VKAAVAPRAPYIPQAGTESWSNVTLLDSPGADSYPIASFSYLVLYKDISTNPNMDQRKAQELLEFITWIINDGQKYSPELHYVPLPDEVIGINNGTLESLVFKGEPIV
jgi:phosphate transport system substrate-binding protein